MGLFSAKFSTQLRIGEVSTFVARVLKEFDSSEKEMEFPYYKCIYSRKSKICVRSGKSHS